MTNIDIEEIVTKRLPYPFKPNCQQDETEIVKKYSYSQATCEVECFLKRIIQRCDCIPDQFVEYTEDNMRVCNVSEMNCVFSSSAQVHCDNCPVQCNAVDYKISNSGLGIGNKLVYKRLKTTPGWENKSRLQIKSRINEDIIGFRIGYKTLEKQIRVYKEAVPWYERLSMLGGIMGLLLGFSVITGFVLYC